MVGDYRPPPDETPPSNVTTTVSSTFPAAGTANSQLSPGSGLSSAAGVLGSLWWLEMTVGVVFLSIFLKGGQQLRRNRPRAEPIRELTEMFAEP